MKFYAIIAFVVALLALAMGNPNPKPLFGFGGSKPGCNKHGCGGGSDPSSGGTGGCDKYGCGGGSTGGTSNGDSSGATGGCGPLGCGGFAGVQLLNQTIT